MIARRLMPKTLSEERNAAATSERIATEYIIDETGRWVLVPPHPGDIFCNPFLNFTEWDSEEDEKGYANL